MLKYIYAEDLKTQPKLADTMFRHRALQFRDRLKWESVTVDENGHERDEYDAMNPLYVIWQNADGTHGGSMRVLPTTGQTMVNDHFLHLTNGVPIISPFIWESTRFCLAPGATPKIAGALMLAGMEIGLRFHLDHAVGVFDARMVRVYRYHGWAPTVVGTEGAGRDAISVGLWEFSEDVRARLAEKAGISLALSEHWFEQSFGSARVMAQSA
ncbi:MAG: autoinducer synthase [Alphaproteobacteria bacterium]|nr:MAG: autoinducer synthase [Alphaproteobacteria bacterium]